MTARGSGGISTLFRLATLVGPLVLLPSCSTPSPPLRPLPAIPVVTAGYRATAEIRWKHAAVNRRGKAALAFRPPREIRVELLDPLGGVGLALISTADGALVVDPGRRSYRRYRDGESAMEALSGLRLRPEDLAAALLGPSPPASGNSPGTGDDAHRANPESGSGSSPGGRAGFPTAGRIPGGSEEVRIRWERDDTSAPPAPPRTTEFRRSDRRGVLRVTLADLVFGPPDSDLFRLDPPAGFRPDGDSPGSPPGGGFSP